MVRKVDDAQAKVIASWMYGQTPEKFLGNLRASFPLVSEATWKAIEGSPELAVLKVIHGKSGMPQKLRDKLSKRWVSAIGKMVLHEEIIREN